MVLLTMTIRTVTIFCSPPSDREAKNKTKNNRPMTKEQSAVSRFFLPSSRQVEHSGKFDDRKEPTERISESKQEVLLTSYDKKSNLESDESIEAQHHETAGEDGIEPILSGKENTLEVESAKETCSNPFAKFAFVASSFSDQTKIRRSRPNNLVVAASRPPKKVKNESWIPMADLSPEERVKVRRKWHGLTDSVASLEDRRFQVLVATRLHARCQEVVVRQCMERLREAQLLTCAAMADADPDVVSSFLTSLQYYNTKSQHLVQAAKQVLQQFDGKVPESKKELLTLTGVGPVMSDLLASINTRLSYNEGGS
jgi:hypothetical protein